MFPMTHQFLDSDADSCFGAHQVWDYDDGQATESMNSSSGASNYFGPVHDLDERDLEKISLCPAENFSLELDERANSVLTSSGNHFCLDSSFSENESGLMSRRSGETPLCPVENSLGELNARTDYLLDTSFTADDLPEARINSNLMDPDLVLYGVTENNFEIMFSSSVLNQMLESDAKFPPEEPAPKRENLSVPIENESLVCVFDQFQQGLNSNAMMVHNDDYFNRPEMQVVDQEKISPQILPTSPPTTEPYTPFKDHGYATLMFDPLVPIKIEVKDECSSDVDVWNDPGQPSPPIAESDPPSPLPCTRTRRSKAKAPQQVSINRAAKTAKRQRNTSSMTTRKHRKVGNSLETSPSGSDSEDPKSPMPPPRRVPAKRGKKTSSAKPTKSEVQRNTHNQNEKMRRTQMTRELNIVRNHIPQFIYDREKCSKSKASKQKVLNAAKRYVDHLKEEQKGGAVTSQEYLYHNLKEELSGTQAKLDKAVKKFMDKYYKVKGYHYTITH